jgi:hypothetical protein
MRAISGSHAWCEVGKARDDNVRLSVVQTTPIVRLEISNDEYSYIAGCIDIRLACSEEGTGSGISTEIANGLTDLALLRCDRPMGRSRDDARDRVAQ